MKKCINCGKIAEDTVKFCPECGLDRFAPADAGTAGNEDPTAGLPSAPEEPAPSVSRPVPPPAGNTGSFVPPDAPEGKKKKPLKTLHIVLIVIGAVVVFGMITGMVRKVSDNNRKIAEAEAQVAETTTSVFDALLERVSEVRAEPTTVETTTEKETEPTTAAETTTREETTAKAETTTKEQTTVPETTTSREYIKCTATELFDLLENNAMKAKSIYKNAYVEISGYVDDIDASGKYITIGARSDNYEYFLDSIQCYIKDDATREKVMDLSKDSYVTIRGQIISVGEFLGYSLNIESIN